MQPIAPPQVHIEPDADHYAEPIGRPRRERRRHIDARTRAILITAIVTAVAVNAGTVWAYLKVAEAAPATARAGVAVDLTPRGRSDLHQPLKPGRTGDLTVTLTNDNDFPIRITSVSPGAGRIVADAEHRTFECQNRSGVSLTRPAFAVSWSVPRNTVRAFTVPDGLSMAADAGPACAGAAFTVPLHATGVSDPAV
jgi:hypothetical protein